jgi:hypothetical protein
MKQATVSANGLLSSQRDLLPKLYQSHRLFVFNFFASLLVTPLWYFWVIFFVAAIAESFQWFLIITAPMWFTVPITVISFWFRGKAFVIYMQSAKRFLDDAKTDINASRTAEDFTTYMNLLFSVLRPTKSLEHTDIKQNQLDIHKIIRSLRIMPIIEVGILVIVILSFVSFFIRRSYILPSLLQTAIIPFLWLNLILWAIRIGIFLRWCQYVSRWLNLYDALITWQANLESIIQQNANITGREI